MGKLALYKFWISLADNSLLYKYKFSKPTKRQRMNDNTKRRISANEQMLKKLADKDSSSKKKKK